MSMVNLRRIFVQTNTLFHTNKAKSQHRVDLNKNVRHKVKHKEVSFL